MDLVGNAPHGVVSVANYPNDDQWQELFAGVGLREVDRVGAMKLYPQFANWIFGRHLHFVVLLEIASATEDSDSE
jgi:hypothetical protein